MELATQSETLIRVDRARDPNTGARLFVGKRIEKLNGRTVGKYGMAVALNEELVDDVRAVHGKDGLKRLYSYAREEAEKCASSNVAPSVHEFGLYPVIPLYELAPKRVLQLLGLPRDAGATGLDDPPADGADALHRAADQGVE